ncbi:flagellar export protein FliJ [Neomoorella thermoacetica]|uniref:flagellar export protein FliJ n=1 Tax=Neomoorella thermoacetica TaxID=1525 RepID=UPI0030D33EBD
MAGFHFSLEKVHSYKLSLEKQLKLQLAESRRRQAEAEASLERYRSLRAGAPAIEGAVAVEELIQKAAYLEALDGRIACQQEEVARASRVVTEGREKVQAAMQERKVLDRLRERQFQAYKYNLAREEQKQVDEAAGSRFYRRTFE